jgi:hypothetical protein
MEANAGMVGFRAKINRRVWFDSHRGSRYGKMMMAILKVK